MQRLFFKIISGISIDIGDETRVRSARCFSHVRFDEMKRLRDSDDNNNNNNNRTDLPWLPVDCDIGFPPCDAARCCDEWDHFLTLLQQKSIIVPSLERYTIDVWREGGPSNTNQWLPTTLYVITKIHSLHWNDDGALWCVIVSLHTIKPWAPDKRGAPPSDGRNNSASIPVWAIAVGEKTKDLRLLEQNYWFMIRDKYSDAYRARHDNPILQGQMTISSEWVRDTMPEQQLQQQSMVASSPHQPSSSIFDMALQWWGRLMATTNDTDDDDTTPLLVQDIQAMIWHLVLLLRYRDRWTALCECAYMSRVVMPSNKTCISFPVARPGAVEDDGEATVMLSITRLLWDDKGPFAVCGHCCTINTHAIGIKIQFPFTSALGVCHDPVCLYHVAEDNTDWKQHGHRYRVEEQINNSSFSSKAQTPHHSLRYMVHRSAQWKPLGRVVVDQQHYLLNDIDAAAMSIIPASSETK